MKKLILLLATAIFTFTACEIIDELGNENNNSNTEQPDEGETPSEGDGETPDSEPKPASNEIWYTNGSTTDATIPNKTDGFGANIVSNLYDDTKECWVATFDGDVTSIGDYAFRSCSSLTSITLPESVTSIGMYAFQECRSLTNITIPENVTSIGVGTFWRCNSLECITIPESVTSISRRTFYSCNSLTSITLPESVTSIEDEAFVNCSSLKAFYGKIVSDDNRCLIVDGVLKSFAPAGLTEYIIPESVTSIGDYAFINCYTLTSITIPESVTSIGGYAFYACI